MAPSRITAKHRQPRANRERTSSPSSPIVASISGARSRWISSTAKSGGPEGARSAAQMVLRMCELEPEVQFPDRVDHVLVAARRPARVALEERQDRDRRVVELQQGVASFDLIGLRLRRPLPGVDNNRKCTVPRSVDMYSIG